MMDPSEQMQPEPAVCMYVCMYVYVCMYMCMYMCACICVYVYVCVYMHKHIQVNTYMQTLSKEFVQNFDFAQQVKLVQQFL